MYRLRRKKTVNKDYRILDNSDENLKRLGFYKKANGTWQKIFSAYKFKNETIIEGRFTIFENSKKVFVDIYTTNGALYAPYYCRIENSLKDNLVLLKCEKSISNMAAKCGIKDKKDIMHHGRKSF